MNKGKKEPSASLLDRVNRIETSLREAEGIFDKVEETLVLNQIKPGGEDQPDEAGIIPAAERIELRANRILSSAHRLAGLVGAEI